MRDYERLGEQDRRDAEAMAYAISAPLHFCAEVPQCDSAILCPLCSNAARLAVQHYRPVVEKRVVGHLVREYDAECRGPHPGSDD